MPLRGKQLLASYLAEHRCAVPAGVHSQGTRFARNLRRETELFAREHCAGRLSETNFSPVPTMTDYLMPNWSRAIVAAVILGLAACGASGGSEDAVETRAATDTVPRPSEQAPPAAVLRKLRSGEADRIADAGGVVVRPRWSRLVVRGRAAGSRVFDDQMFGADLAEAHIYRGYVREIGQHVVERVYFPEGGEFVMVGDARADTLAIDHVPVPAPGGERFATASVDLVAGHRPNRVRIYRMAGGRPVLEWEHAPVGWGIDSLRWRDPRTLDAVRVTLDTTRTPFRTVHAPARVELAGEEWRIADGRAPAPLR